MKTKEELISRYHQLFEKMVSEKKPKQMKIFGDAERYVFEDLAGAFPDKAESWLNQLEAICWDNYLSEKEMINIGKRLHNSDGTNGLHWNYDTFIRALQSLGGVVEEMPYYNSYALCAVANMVYSDHAKSISEDMGYKSISEVSGEKMALSCYRKAVEKLKDIDDNFRVRDYFKGKMYDNSPM